MKKLNVLFISIAFPPKQDSEGLQVAKYLKYLLKDKSLTIDVVTSEDKTLFMPIYTNLVEYLTGVRQIIKVPFFENKYSNFIKRKINRSSLNYPDSKYRFYKKWKYVVDELKKKPDVIYSRSYPLSSTLMAYYLQKEFKIPWILHLSDPWTINPIHALEDAQHWNSIAEKKCFHHASMITFTSEETLNLYILKYPNFKTKMMLSYNVFDLEDKKIKFFMFKDKLKIVYTGGLAGERSPEYILNAIVLFEKNYPQIINDFEFIFAGALDKKNSVLFKGVPKSVKHLGLLSFENALKLQESADILLVIDILFDDVNDAIFFPSKLLDYMLSEKRVLALTTKGSPTWNIVNDKMGNCVEHRDIDAIVQFFRITWEKWKLEDKDYFVRQEIDMKFSAEQNAQKISNALKRLVV